MKTDITQLLKELKAGRHAVNPDAHWMQANRMRLLNAISHSAAPSSRTPFLFDKFWSALSFIMPQRTAYFVVRPIMVFVAVFGMASAGWITTVSASFNSLPGDKLYPVKIAAERTQVAVVEALQGKAASAELRLDLATRRLNDVHKIIEAPITSASKKEKVNTVVQEINSDLQTVNKQLEEAKKASPVEAVAVAQVVDRKVDELKASLETASQKTESEEAVSAVSAVAQLKSDADAVRANPIMSTDSTSTIVTETGSATTTVAESGQSNATSTTQASASSTAVSTPSGIVSSTPSAFKIIAPIEPMATTTQKEQPLELAPDVVDEPVPIKIEAWE